jgi:hypothetical protein
MNTTSTELARTPPILEGEFEGEYNKPFSSFREALDYLRRYSLGTIEHPDMNRLSFVYVRKDGHLAFADLVETRRGSHYSTEVTDSLLTEEELAEFEDETIWHQSNFVYMPSSEMGCRNDGTAWFDELRSQPSTLTPTL